MASPQSTNINALAITPDLRYWMTGGSDGYVRKYDGAATINGKQLLTVAQRHPFVDSVVKAAVLMSYWENEEPTPPASARGAEEHVQSPVYSLAVHSQALWLLAGTESGGINLQSVRHDEGKRITCMQRHTNAVSALLLVPDEKSVLSGSWDKNIFDWDLNNGQVRRQFEGSGSQISVLELRPASGAPISQASYDEPAAAAAAGSTLSGSNAAPLPNGVAVTNGVNGGAAGEDGPVDVDAAASPAHESLFGSPGGSLFGGDNDAAAGATAGENPFGDGGDGGDGEENDAEFSQMEMTLQGSAEPPSRDGAVAGAAADDLPMTGMSAAPAGPLVDPDAGPPPAVQPLGAAVAAVVPGNDRLTNGNHRYDAPMVNGNAAGHALDGAGKEQVNGGAPRPNMVFQSQPGPTRFDPSQTSETTFFSASIDGIIRIWDRRVMQPVARIGNRPGVPPWCMGACWSPDGNTIYAGRRNGIVEEFNIHKARNGWQPERVLKFPNGSGPVSAIRAMVNGRHLVWYVPLCSLACPCLLGSRRPPPENS